MSSSTPINRSGLKRGRDTPPLQFTEDNSHARTTSRAMSTRGRVRGRRRTLLERTCGPVLCPMLSWVLLLSEDEGTARLRREQDGFGGPSGPRTPASGLCEDLCGTPGLNGQSDTTSVDKDAPRSLFPRVRVDGHPYTKYPRAKLKFSWLTVDSGRVLPPP